jgi:hypothetical protein
VISGTEVGELKSLNSEDRKEWCDEAADTGGDARRCFYGDVGQPELGLRGGATFTFKGTGEWVCLVVDPETVFWNASIQDIDPTTASPYRYPDEFSDDGDIDIFSGLSSYYNGSPGVELGDFKGYYTDSLGRQIEIEYGECSQNGSSQSGITNAHAGRGTAEYCDINTDLREGVEYTAVLETFSVPLDDGVLSFGTMIVEGRCSQVQGGMDECTLLGEGTTSQLSDPTDGEKDARACTEKLEKASCNGYLREFCCANPEMCHDDPPEGACIQDWDGDGTAEEFEEEQRETFCSEPESSEDVDTRAYCCEYQDEEEEEEDDK